MRSEIKLNFDQYFDFLKEYIEMFKTQPKRKKIIGEKFLI